MWMDAIQTKNGFDVMKQASEGNFYLVVHFP
jgi:hypothetical protein